MSIKRFSPFFRLWHRLHIECDTSQFYLFYFKPNTNKMATIANRNILLIAIWSYQPQYSKMHNSVFLCNKCVQLTMCIMHVSMWLGRVILLHFIYSSMCHFSFYDIFLANGIENVTPYTQYLNINWERKNKKKTKNVFTIESTSPEILIYKTIAMQSITTNTNTYRYRYRNEYQRHKWCIQRFCHVLPFKCRLATTMRKKKKHIAQKANKRNGDESLIYL